MSEISREDIENAVMTDDFDYDQFVSLLTKHIEIQIPDKFSVLNKPKRVDGTLEPFTASEDVLRKELIEHVLLSIDDLNKKEKHEEPTIIDPVPTSIGNPGGTKETVHFVPPDDLPDVPNEKLGIPEIKIDLNLGIEDASEPSSAEDVVIPEVEELVEVGDLPLGRNDSPVIQEASSTTEAVTSVTPGPASPSSNPAYADRKSHIIALVKESKWTLRQVTQIIDDQWGYAAQGKSSKTRVSKTVRDLRDNNLIYEESNGVLMWRGEG